MEKSFYLAILFSTFLCVGPSQAQVPFSGVINSDYTLDVPADFANINLALNYLSNKTIDSGAIVTIQVADGTYTGLDEIVVKHPQGDRIHILGNTTTPNNCALSFTSNGISVNDGNSIGLIDGFLISGSNSDYGIHANGAGSIYCGPNLNVSSFSQGVYAEYGATIYAEYVHSSYNSGNGILARGATIKGDYAVVDHNTQSGVAAIDGGTVTFQYGDSSYNTVSGVQVYSGGTVTASSANVHDNPGLGFLALTNGTIYATSITYSNNGTHKQVDAFGGTINF